MAAGATIVACTVSICAAPFNFANPAAQNYVANLWLSDLSGYSGLSIDNVAVYNKYNEAGYYANPTDAPCTSSEQPSCGGTWVALYSCTADGTCSNADPNWIVNNLAWLNYINSQAAPLRVPTWCNLAGQDIDNTTASQGTDFVNAAEACSGVTTESVPQNGSLSDAKKYYNGFLIDNLFMEAFYGAENITTRPYLHNSYYANDKDTANGTPAEEEYCLAWSLLVQRNAAQNYTFCGALGSALLPAYPPSIGGRVAASITGTLTQYGVSVTSLSSTAYLAPGLMVSSPDLPQGAYIEGVPSSAVFTGGIAAGSSAASFTGGISGTTLTVASTPAPSGSLAVGQILTGGGAAPCTTLIAFVSGTGGAGTYTVKPSQTVASGASLKAGSTGTLTVAAMASGPIAVGQTLTIPGMPGCMTITAGGSGTYTVTPSATVPSASFTGSIAQATQTASFTGAIVGTQLAASSISGSIAIGMALTGTNVVAGTTITGLVSSSGAYTYTVSPSQSVSSTTITGSITTATLTVATSPTPTGTLAIGQIVSGSGTTVAGGTVIIANSASGGALCNGSVCTGTGVAGTYAVSIPQTVTSESMTSATQMYGASSLTLSAPALTSGSGQTLQISGFAPLPIGAPVQSPPAVNPYGTTPMAACGGFVDGTTFIDYGVCGRQYSNGWVWMNPVCHYSTGCLQAPAVITIPPTLGAGSWWDTSCNYVPVGPYSLAPATALVIAYGANYAYGPCPWPQP